MSRLISCVLFLLAGISAFAYEVSVGTFVANPGQRVPVPVQIDTIKGASFVSVRITYDPQILILMKAEQGSLTEVLDRDFVVAGSEQSGSVTISGYGTGNVSSNVGGSLVTLIFAVREGTQGLYSDVAVANVKVGEISGVKDLTVAKPVAIQSGMVRVMGTDATVERLENPQTICADSSFASLNLLAGDAIQASDSQTGIVVAGTVGTVSAIEVVPPVTGWASGRYALLSTPTRGLAFELMGTTGKFSSDLKNGVTTYYATVEVPGELPVVCADEELSAGSMNQIRANAQLVFKGKTDSESLARKAMYESAKKIAVEGPKGSVGIIADMGISPAFVGLDETGTLHLSYAMPSLAITSFSPETGAVRFKVTPGEGNQIVSELATGYLHVYGTDNLGEKMRYISSVGFDLTPYLKADTRGEGLLHVELGTHSFLKIKVESVQKTEGQPE